MSASRAIQAASIFYLDNLLATASALHTSSCLLFWLHFSTSTFSRITIFWICRIQLLPQGCGKPCIVSSTSHSPSLLELVPIQPPLTWSHCVSFWLHYSPPCNSSHYSTSLTFSPHTFFWIFHISIQDEEKGGSLPHQVLLLTLFFCWNVHSSSFCTEGAVAISISCSRGRKVPVYKVKFVIRKFLLGGNYHQEAVVISSDHTVPHHRWQIFMKLSPLQF